jgi:hypothetical protein
MVSDCFNVFSGGSFIIVKLYGLSYEMTKRKKNLVSSMIFLIGYISYFVCFALYLSKNTEQNFIIEYTALLRRNTVWYIIPSIFKGELSKYLLLLVGGTVPLVITSAIASFLAINVDEIEDTRQFEVWREDIVDTRNNEILETSYTRNVSSGESEGQQIMNLVYVVIVGNLFMPIITMGIIGIYYTSRLFTGIKKYVFMIFIIIIVALVYFIK